MANQILTEPIRLTDTQRQELIDMQDMIDLLRLEIDKATRAGIVTTDLKKRFDTMVNLRNGLLKEYS